MGSGATEAVPFAPTVVIEALSVALSHRVVWHQIRRVGERADVGRVSREDRSISPATRTVVGLLTVHVGNSLAGSLSLGSDGLPLASKGHRALRFWHAHYAPYGRAL